MSQETFSAVKQMSFVAQYEALWQEFDTLCAALPNKNDALKSANKKVRHALPTLSSDAQYRLAVLYRQICQHYALACQRNYSPVLTEQLHERVMLGHRLIYRNKTSYGGRFINFVLDTFPNAVRRHYRLFWLGMALFYVPAIIMGIACYLNNELIYSVMDYHEVALMEEMYNPANEHIGRGSDRASDTDVMMFGYYVQNNVSIDFQVYAMGIFFGIGTAFVTLYNGIVIGAVSGHLTQAGFSETFWSFVSGHGSFELTAIAISAAAGFRLATPLIAPAPYGRRDAFLVAGKESIQLLLGAALMTFIAAFIEAFWSSSSSIPNGVKYTVATCLWLFVAWYLMFCGRRKERDSDDGYL